MNPPYFFILSAISSGVEGDRRVEEGEEEDEEPVADEIGGRRLVEVLPDPLDP